jgi:hypothetical protein
MIVEDKIVERTMFGCTESGKMNKVGILSHGVLFFFPGIVCFETDFGNLLLLIFDH